MNNVGHKLEAMRSVAREIRTEKGMIRLNAWRKLMGLEPIVQKKRKCLNCNREFDSTSKYNKLCQRCGTKEDRAELI